jgi:hypothetical protein
LATRPQPRTRNGLLPEAAHLVLPRGIVSDAFPSTYRVCERIGIIFDPWQCGLNRCILGKTRSGLYAADTVLLSIPRQVGKTFDIGGLVFADAIINPGSTTVWTAHRFKVARESFNEMRSWARSAPLGPHIDYDDITTAAGNECIPFRNGSRIVFAARERGAIRGFTKVRRLILDEAQILTEYALSDLVPTMNQAVNPQIILMCTPPKPTDPGEVVRRIRAEALAGDSEGVLYAEMSAPPGSAPDDRTAWAKANPSYPKRTPAKAILRMRKLLSPADFLREALGMWDGVEGGVINAARWRECEDAASAPTGTVAIGFSVASDLSCAAIGISGRRADGLGHIELVDYRVGTVWLTGRLKEMAARWKPCAVVLNPSSAAAAIEKDLIENGVKPKPGPGEHLLHVVGGREWAQACVALTRDIKDHGLRFLPAEPLETAVGGAGSRKLGDSWAFTPRDGTGDICPLEAVTLARHGFMTHGLTTPPDPFILFGR